MSAIEPLLVAGTIDLRAGVVAWADDALATRVPAALTRRLLFTARTVCEGLDLYAFDQLCWDGDHPYQTPVAVERVDDATAEFRLGAEHEIDPDRLFGFVPSSVFKKSELVYLLSDAEPSLHPGPRVVYVSPAFESMTGYQSSDIVGATPRILQGEKTEAASRAMISAALKAWRPVCVEITNYRKDGTMFRSEVDITPVRDRLGWYEYWFAAQRDVTEQAKQRELVAHQRKLESLGELAAGVAHEVNTPMQCIASNLNFLQDFCDVIGGLLPERADSSQDEIASRVADALRDERTMRLLKLAPGAVGDSVTAADQVSRIVQTMKSMAHPRSSDLADVNVNEVVAQALAVSRNRWKYDAEARCELSPDEPTIASVAGELSQVVINLVVNAADAIGEHRAASDGLGHIAVRTFSDGDGVVIEVEDNGPGIPEAIRDRIFDPFFTTKEVGKGSGQGLSIVFDIVAKRGGGKVEALPGRDGGALFRVALPRTPPRATEAP